MLGKNSKIYVFYSFKGQDGEQVKGTHYGMRYT